MSFSNKSSDGIKNFTGSIDGILIWIWMPSEKEWKEAEYFALKFMCGRKHQYELNCQAVCNEKGDLGDFIDILIKYPGSISDILSCEGKNFTKNLKEESLKMDCACWDSD